MRFIDGDSHFIEPLDLFTHYIDAPYRERAMRMEIDPTSDQPQLLVDGRPMRLVDVDELLGAVVGYGQKETGRRLGDFPSLLAQSRHWQDMGERIGFLDREGFAAQVLYPTMGLLWEGSVDDPLLAAAHCRAYNTWAFELCADHKERLYPAAHISLRDAALAVVELERVAKLGARTIFIGAAPVGGRSFGHPAYDPIWAATQSLDLSVGIHLVGHANYTGSQWYREGNPGFMYVTMNVIQDPRQALTTMVYDGVFERFPKLRVATIEAMAGWVGEWIERLDYRYRYMGHTSRMKRPASEYFERNIWISADPVERTLPY
ncbi:MAG: amidohydrolase family protein, partial [Candidatus Binataceae bacterium]